MNNKLFLYMLAIMIIAGCKNNSVQISGTLVNPNNGKYIYLDELKSNELINN